MAVELWWRIWAAYYEELGPQPMILEFNIEPGEDKDGNSRDNLKRLTAPVRNALSLSRDSRAHALRALPSTMVIPSGQGIIRYLATRDVLKLNYTIDDVMLHDSGWRLAPGFSDQVVNLCICHQIMPKLNALCLLFPNLRHVFFYVPADMQKPSDLLWCGTERARSARSHHHVYFWPSLG
ncbi:hypothetical protein IMZ48_40410, partial [Candidatus Bathyarchaeota archaeon]|nr:hypothetical protein [Candidatus Bathyarchaeota archaeon]